jgi:hypothetical protein
VLALLVGLATKMNILVLSILARRDVATILCVCVCVCFHLEGIAAVEVNLVVNVFLSCKNLVVLVYIMLMILASLPCINFNKEVVCII